MREEIFITIIIVCCFFLGIVYVIETEKRVSKLEKVNETLVKEHEWLMWHVSGLILHSRINPDIKPSTSKEHDMGPATTFEKARDQMLKMMEDQ